MSPAQSNPDARPSPIAGRWYPGDASELTQTIDRLLDEAQVAPSAGKVVGLLAPHAGLRYSGHVAAHAFKLVSDLQPAHVVVISPMHHPYAAPILTSAHSAYQTPLGDLPVDHDVLAAIHARVPLDFVTGDPEHALEIELPFLQRTLGAFSLTPLMLRDQTIGLARRLGEALAEILSKRGDCLLVASSDLSHRYTYEQAASLDRVVLRHVEALDAEALIRADEEGNGFACGRGGIATMLVAARQLGANAGRVVNYATSAEVTGDYGEVVGYGAAVVEAIS